MDALFNTLYSNHYHTLNLPVDATSLDVKRAYRKLAKKYHPDYNPEDKNAEQKFLEITIAYETLSNELLRAVYDRSISGKDQYINTQLIDKYYLHVTANASIVKCCEEFELCFTYIGDGRNLKKPPLGPFNIASRPYVDFRMLNINETMVRETCITYTLSSPISGKFKIGAASIRIHNQIYQSLPVYITIEPSGCYYSKTPLPSDGLPVRYKMYNDYVAGSKNNRFIETKTHMVLIPRSNKAMVLHNLGMAIKIVFALWGAILAMKLSINVFFGIAAGTLYGGISCYILYFFNKIKPRFYFSDNHSVVKKYEGLGYKRIDSFAGGNPALAMLAYFLRLFY